MEPAPMDTVPSVVGQDKSRWGFSVSHFIPLDAAGFAHARRVVAVVLYQQKIPLGAVRRLLGNVRIPGQPEGLD